MRGRLVVHAHPGCRRRERERERESERERERERETLLGVSRDARDQMLRADLDLIEKIPYLLVVFCTKRETYFLGSGPW